MKTKKFISKNICKMVAFVLIVSLVSTTFSLGNIVKATENDKDFIKTFTTYNDEKTKATILFDMDSVEKERYEITKITSDKDDKVVYDKSTITEENANQPVVYDVVENSNYDFTVKYVEKNKRQDDLKLSGRQLIVMPNKNDGKKEEQDIDKDTTNKKESIDTQKEESIKVSVAVTEIVKIIDKEKTEKTQSKKTLEDFSKNKKDIPKEEKNNVVRKRRSVEQEHPVSVLDNQKNNDEYIDLRNQYNIHSWISKKGNFYKEDVSGQLLGSVETNRLKTSTARNDVHYQTSALTYKGTIDFSRSFEMSGSFKFDGDLRNADGIAIAFHNDGTDYAFDHGIQHIYSSKMGVYHGDYPNSGIKSKAVVAEVDLYDNQANNNTEIGDYLGDNLYGGIGENGAHIAISTLNEKLNVPGAIDVKNFKGRPHVNNESWLKGKKGQDGIEKPIDYKLIWTNEDGVNGVLRLELIDANNDLHFVEYRFNPQTYFNDYKAVNMTVGAGAGRFKDIYSGEIIDSYLTLNKFKYTDLNAYRNIKVEVNNSYFNGGKSEVVDTYNFGNLDSVKRLLQPEQEAIIRLDFKNLFADTAVNISEPFYLEDLSYKGKKLELLENLEILDDDDFVNSIYAVDETTSQVFKWTKEQVEGFIGRGEPLLATYPKNGGLYSIYIGVKLPENIGNDFDGELANIKMLFGQSGMNQYRLSKQMAVIKKPTVQNSTTYIKEAEKVENVGSARTYEDTQMRKIDLVSESNNNNIKIHEAKYSRFDYEKANADNPTVFEEGLSKDEFINHFRTTSGHTDAYVMDYRVRDARRDGLNPAQTPVLVSDWAKEMVFLGEVNVTSNDNNSGYVMLSNADELTITLENFIDKYNGYGELYKYIKEQLSVKMFIIDNGVLKRANDYRLQELGEPDEEIVDVSKLVVGDNKLKISGFAGDEGSKKRKVIELPITLRITESPIQPEMSDIKAYHTNGNGVNDKVITEDSTDLRDLNDYAVAGNEITYKFSVTSNNVTNREREAELIIDKLIIPNTSIDLSNIPITVMYRYSNPNGIGEIGRDIPDIKVGDKVDVLIPRKGIEVNYQIKFTIPEGAKIDFGEISGLDLPKLETQITISSKESKKSATKSLSNVVATDPLVRPTNAYTNHDEKIDENKYIDAINTKKYGEKMWQTGSDALVDLELIAPNAQKPEERYYSFDEAQNKFVLVGKDEIYKTDKVGVYSYHYKVRDTRHNGGNSNGGLISDESLVRNFVGSPMISDNTNDHQYVVLTKRNNIVLSETKMAKDGYNVDKFMEILKSELDLKGYVIKKDNNEIGETLVKAENIKVSSVKDDNGADFDFENPKAGNYDVRFKVSALGLSEKEVGTFTLTVTSNTWSYDTKFRTEENGASGFIVIPKGIELKIDQDDPSIISSTKEVYFANYPEAKKVKYNLSVDRTFDITRINDVNDKIKVTSSLTNGLPENITQNKLFIGSINNKNTKDNGHKVKFSAPVKKITKVKGRWEGYVNFYFERQ